MYTSPYDVLVPWCKLPEHAGQTDEERLAALQAETVAIPKSEAWVSYRTFSILPGLGPIAGQRLADKLEAIYATIPSSDTDDAGVASRLVHANIGYMRDPSKEGIDVSPAAVRAFLPALIGTADITAEEIAAITAHGVQTVSQLAAWGINIRMSHIASARKLIEEEMANG